MAVSRYKNLNIIDNKYLETPEIIKKRDLNNISTINIRTGAEDRLDVLAAKYLGDGSYWWVIAQVNDLEHAFDFIPGKILKIPLDLEEFLKLV